MVSCEGHSKAFYGHVKIVQVLDSEEEFCFRVKLIVREPVDPEEHFDAWTAAIISSARPVEYPVAATCIPACILEEPVATSCF